MFYDITLNVSETQYFVTAKLPKAWGLWAFEDEAAGHGLPEVEAVRNYALRKYGADLSLYTLQEVGEETFLEPFGPEGKLTELVEFHFVDFRDLPEHDDHVPDDEEEFDEDFLEEEWDGEEGTLVPDWCENTPTTQAFFKALWTE